MFVIQKILQDLKAKVQNIPIEAMFQKVTQENVAVIEDKNIAQMEAGLDAHGLEIEPPYTEFTVGIKKALGQPFDRVTLKNQGDFHKGTKAEVSISGFEMTNTDSKWGKLSEKYGDVIGLNDTSKQELIDEIYTPQVGQELVDYFDHG